MPNYNNPYNTVTFYPSQYYSLPTMQQQAQWSANDNDLIMKWVDGEVGVKAFQMPPGWPVNKPIPLWDSTDTIVWIKSWNQIGAPNPMQKLRYEMQDQPQITLPASTDMSKFVTNEDMQKFNLQRVAMNELRKLDSLYADKNEFTEADAKKYDCLMHGLKCQLTAEAMMKAEESGEGKWHGEIEKHETEHMGYTDGYSRGYSDAMNHANRSAMPYTARW